MPDSNVCPECGAVVPEDAQKCGLCGTPVTNATSAGEETVPEEEAATTPSPASGGDEEGVFCNECGWENPPGANFCSRCGYELQSLADSGATHDDGSSTKHSPGSDAPPGAKPAAGPPDTDEAASPSSEPPPRESTGAPAPVNDPASGKGMARRVALVVAVAALAVGGLYGWSAWSGGASPGGGSETTTADGGSPSVSGRSPSTTMGGGGPGSGGPSSSEDATRSGDVPKIIRRQQGGDVPASLAARADSLRTVIETRGGRRKRLARRQLGSLFAQAGLTKQAAAQQWRLAQEAGADPEAWERAGSLLFDWMVSLSRRDRAQAQERAEVARLTVDAYERVLESRPENYDVRTNLAVAYLSTNNPMRGISEIKRVLQERPDHVGARFNYGLMQRMIGRNATALEQFERVLEIAGEDSPYYEQAEEAIQLIRKQTDGPPKDAPMPGQGNSGRSASSTPGS